MAQAFGAARGATPRRADARSARSPYSSCAPLAQQSPHFTLRPAKELLRLRSRQAEQSAHGRHRVVLGPPGREDLAEVARELRRRLRHLLAPARVAASDVQGKEVGVQPPAAPAENHLDRVEPGPLRQIADPHPLEMKPPQEVTTTWVEAL